MRPAPLFKETLPFARPHIAGFERGQRVEFADSKSHTLTRRGYVSVTFPSFNEVVIRCDNGIITTIAPERVRRIV